MAMTNETESAAAAVPANDLSAPAAIAPATEFAASGAPVQNIVVDTASPSIDNDFRAGTTKAQNKIDMNDPSF